MTDRNFSCRCSTPCTKGVDWFARAPLSECFRDDEECRCACHANAVAFAESKQRLRAAGRLTFGYILPDDYSGRKPAVGVTHGN